MSVSADTDAVAGNLGDPVVVCLSASPGHACPAACQWLATVPAAQEHAGSLCSHANLSRTGAMHNYCCV